MSWLARVHLARLRVAEWNSAEPVSIVPVFPEEQLWEATEDDRADKNCHADQVPAVRTKVNHTRTV